MKKRKKRQHFTSSAVRQAPGPRAIEMEPEDLAVYVRRAEKEVLPILRKQNGFQEEVTLVNPKGAVGISLWDNRQHAETYDKAGYPQVLAKLTPVIAGTPTVETYETASTYLPV